mgnify:CR=1 FL=1
MDIKISFDKTAFQCKPTNRQTAFMKKRLPKEEDYYDIKTIAERIGNHGHSFLPATFEGLASKQENFEQCQLFGIDFDDEPDYEKIKKSITSCHGNRTWIYCGTTGCKSRFIQSCNTWRQSD